MTPPPFKLKPYSDPMRHHGGYYLGPTYQTKALPSKAPQKGKER